MPKTDRPLQAEIRIGNAVAEMKDVVEFVESFGRDHDLPAIVTNGLNLCLDEILNNTISYGYDDGGKHIIRVGLSVENNVLIAEVEDDARPFDPRQAALPNVAGGLEARKAGGLGIHFVMRLMDGVDYVRSGAYNQLTLRKQIP